jgi:hypothetical protein
VFPYRDLLKRIEDSRSQCLTTQNFIISQASLIVEVNVRETGNGYIIDHLELFVPEDTPPSSGGVERRVVLAMKPSEDPHNSCRRCFPLFDDVSGDVRSWSIVQVSTVDVG